MRKTVFRLALILLLALICIIFFSRNVIRKQWGNFLSNIKINFDNFFYEMSPERSKPISTLEKETRLITLIQDPFRDFTQDDWQKFWHIIYGVYPEKPQAGKASKKRQLTQDEMEEQLIKDYPMPFSYFTEQHWAEFWKIIK